MRPTILILALLAIASPRAVLADSSDSALAYSVATSEIAVALRFTVGWGRATEGVPLAATVIGGVAAPVLVGYLAHRFELDPRPARALHGAGFLGISMFLAGVLVDGREDAWNLRIGPAALILGGVGAAVGGYYGATQVTDDGAWLAGPALGFVGGFLVLGTGLVLAGGVDGDDAPGQWALGAAVGGIVGTGIAAFLARDTSNSPVPTVDVGNKKTIISFGGQF